MADRKLSQLTALTAPASDDEFLVLDTSESNNADKNKKIGYGTLLTKVPVGSVTAPSFGFTGDSDATGFFRSAEDEIAISTGDALNSKFTTTGFQIGSGTAGAPLHVFKTSSGDDVIIENSEAGSTEGPNLVLFRNSASPAADDILGTVDFRGEDSAGNTQSYAEVAASIFDASNSSEDGRLDFVVTKAGSPSTVMRLQEDKVGINELVPEAPFHVTDTTTEAVRIECPNNDAASGADIRMYRHRADAVGQDNDVLSTIFFRGNNDDSTQAQRPVDYAAIQAVIADASDATEDGKLRLQVQTAGTLTTQLEVNANTIGFFGTTPATQATAITDINTTATTGTLPTASDTNTISNAASATNAELLQYCVTLESKVEALIDALQRHGLMGT
tara:strand:- start:49 stop:1215 length:1167 start_codon:yes stop_codon:yes gene_type:complete